MFENLSDKSKEAIRWLYLPSNENLTVKEAREIMTEKFGKDVMDEIEKANKKYEN